jgi:hypothetical protein
MGRNLEASLLLLVAFVLLLLAIAILLLSAAHRHCLASLARRNLLFLQAILFTKP